jgi:hypothetical protein
VGAGVLGRVEGGGVDAPEPFELRRGHIVPTNVMSGGKRTLQVDEDRCLLTEQLGDGDRRASGERVQLLLA